jgi:hypothetical protein
VIINFDSTALGHPLTLQELEALANGKARVCSRHSNEGPKSYRLSEEQREIFEQTKTSGVIFDKPEKVAWLAQWWLETTGQPCIRVSPRGKLAQVSMDLITCSREDGNLWTGTNDRPKYQGAQHAYAAERHATREERRRASSPLPEDTRRFDQATILLLAESCVRHSFNNVVRWNRTFWEYNGLHYEQISRDALKYEVWPILGGWPATSAAVNKVLAAIIEMLPEVKGEAPQWITRRDGDPEADQLIVRTDEIFNIYEREAYPASPCLFATSRGASDLVNALALAAGAHPRGWFSFGTYTSIERVPVANAAALARELRALYWTVIGKKPPA